jgi:hypothetical protein
VNAWRSLFDPLLRASRLLVRPAQLLVARLPERLSRALLARALAPFPQLWGWSVDGERLRCARCSYRRAFPGGDSETFLREATATRASALAASLTYLARTQAGRPCSVLEPVALGDGDGRPCIVAHLHYAIDPAPQVAFMEANRGRDMRWAVYPAQAGRARRWEGERSLFLAGGVPKSIASRLLYITDASWLTEALRHLRRGGGVLLALDAAMDSRRSPSVWLRVGQASMPVSAAIEMLARATGARLAFIWPEPRADGNWSLHCEHLADTAALADAASRWIATHRIHWAGWPYLTWRLRRTDMEHGLVPL